MSKTILAHDGGFHTDDIFAVATLLLLEPDARVVRSRDGEEIEKADYVVDVGFVHNPELRRFDHHQAGGAGERENGIPYASFGLVWKAYGAELAGGEREAKRIDRKLIQPIDAFDNGTAIYTSLYDDVRWYDIGDYLFSYVEKGDVTAEKLYERFMQLVGVAKDLLVREMRLAREYIEGEDALIKIYNNAPDKRLLEMPSEDLPWRGIYGNLPEPLYVLYKRTDQSWAIKAVPDLTKPFGHNRKDLPESWGGKQGEDAQEATGVADAVFAHRGLFMAVAKSKEGALALAKKALEQ